VVTYFHYVLEAKLVTSTGLAISLASKFIENDPGRDYEKQDCEQKAFVRLAAKIKKYFPRSINFHAFHLLPCRTIINCLLTDRTYNKSTGRTKQTGSCIAGGAFKANNCGPMEENDGLSNISTCGRNQPGTKHAKLITHKHGLKTVEKIIHSRIWIKAN